MICAPNEDSDQTGHPSSLTRVFAVRSVGSYKDPSFLHADSDDWDQIGRMQAEFYLTLLQLVLCRVAAVSPYINHSAVYILFWSFEISDNILRNQK